MLISFAFADKLSCESTNPENIYDCLSVTSEESNVCCLKSIHDNGNIIEKLCVYDNINYIATNRMTAKNFSKCETIDCGSNPELKSCGKQYTNNFEGCYSQKDPL
jgi:hypothetical protein